MNRPVKRTSSRDSHDSTPTHGRRNAPRRGFVVERYRADLGEENPTVASGTTSDDSLAPRSGFHARLLIAPARFAFRFELETDPETTRRASAPTTRIVLMNTPCFLIEKVRSFTNRSRSFRLNDLSANEEEETRLERKRHAANRAIRLGRNL